MIQNGEILDGMYQIIKEIGSGGTGIIYLAEHLRLCKKVVVKKIKDHFVGQVNERAEVDILKRLHHTCLPQVYDFLVLNNSVYTVMEYIEGRDLQYYLDNGYQFSEPLLYNWLLQLCEVLEYLHTQTPQILHSDIKPSNLMITKDSHIYLIDFNISLDGENSKDVKGVSNWYAAPEQYERAQEILNGKPLTRKLDERMDIYSLGATFYRMMTGCLPNVDGHMSDIMQLDIPYTDGMKSIVSRMMKRSPEARFQNARAVRKRLLDVARMDPIYKRNTYVQVGSFFVWIVAVIVGVLFIYYGSWQNTIEKWNESYQDLYVSVSVQDEIEIVSKATAILNNFAYRNFLSKNEDKKAQVLYILGESYFRQEMYHEASEYYKEAWELTPNHENYARDYIIALVRNGNNTTARQILESSQGSCNLTEAERLLIIAEIAWNDKDEDMAIANIKKLVELPASKLEKDTLQKAYILVASIYETKNDYLEAWNMLQQALKVEKSQDVLRYMGRLSANIAYKESKKITRNFYLYQALDCYEELNQMANPTYNDKMNLALVTRGLEDYEKSNLILSEMLLEYPEKYQIPMWMCYNYLDMGNDKEIVRELEYRYKDCKYKYDKSGVSDSDMENLMELIRRGRSNP